MSKSVCPTCGCWTDEPITYQGGRQHRCKPAVLKAIDATLAADRLELPREPTLEQRLRDGFRMLNGGVM